MITAEKVNEAHEASVRMAEMEDFSGVKTGPNDTHGQYLDELHLGARNAIFHELSPGHRIIRGEPVVQGVESLFYALGQDAGAAETAASRLGGVVEPSDETDKPEVVLSSDHYGRINHVGTLATDEYRADGVYLRTKSFAERPHIFNGRLADLVIPYGTYFLGHDDGQWFAHTSDGASGYDAVSIGVKDLIGAKEPAIFDDPEEAAAFRDRNPHAAFMLVGSEAVLGMLNDAGVQNQSATAVKNMLEATVYGRERPSVEDIDLIGSVGVGIDALMESYDYPAFMPAEAHPSILSQMPVHELLTASRSAVSGISKEQFAKSERMGGLRLNRKLEGAISDLAHKVVSDFLGHAGVDQGEVSEDERAALEAELVKGCASSLDEHLAFNHGYKYAVKPFGPRMQRRNVARVMRAHQAG